MVWTNTKSLRSFVARNRLATAFALSLTVHLALFGGWKIGKQLGWWEHQATWLLDWKKKLRPKALQPQFSQLAAVPVPREIPLTFVEVDPSVATPEPPKDAKYYSSQNARAANTEPKTDTT